MAALTDMNYRFEMAAGDTPRSAAPSYSDLTGYVRIGDGISTSRGRSNTQDAQAQSGRASVVLKNSTAAFTMGNTGSTFAPLQLRRPCRFRVRTGTTSGNFLAAESASFEGGTAGSWIDSGRGVSAPTIANSSTRAQSGTKSLLLSWPAAAIAGAGAFVTGLVIGRTYTASAYVYIPVGSPAATLDVDVFVGVGASTSSTAAWVRLSRTFVAINATHFVEVWATSTGAGQQVWVDAVMVDEGSSAGTFTTTAPPIYDLWAGYVDDWGNRRDDLVGVAALSLSDQLSRAARSKLPAALDAEILSDSPDLFYPLSDSVGTTTAGDLTGATARPRLVSTQLGSAGVLGFGVGDAPGPDTSTVAAFTRSTAVNGRYLTLDGPVSSFSTWNLTLSAMVRPSTSAAQMSAARVWSKSDSSAYTELGVSSTGKARTSYLISGFTGTLVGTTTLPTTSASHVTVTQSVSALFITVTLFVNGVQEATATNGFSAFTTGGFQRVNVGGGTYGDLWDGQISHVAVWSVAITTPRLLEHANGRNGWVGETSDVRFNRLCRVAGLPATRYATSGTGLSTMASQPTLGMSLLDALRDVAEAEAGVIYVTAAGVIRFAVRGARYNAPVAFTLDATKAGHVGVGFEVMTDDSLVINDATVSRPSGATQRVTDASSVIAYDTHDLSFSMFVDSDDLTLSAAQWAVFTSSTPDPRSDEITIDVVAFSGSGGDLAALLAADNGTRFQVINIPTDVSATATLDLFVEGIRHGIFSDRHKVILATSAVGASGSVFIVENARYGQLDTGGVLTF